MVKNIVSAFERNFKAIIKKSGAKHSEFIKDEDSAIGTLYFENFKMELEYILESEERAEHSWIAVILDFSQRAGKELRCSLYDIIDLVDKDNFDCWFFPNIENANRLDKCFACLWKSLERVIELIDEYCCDDENIKKIDQQFEDNASFALCTGLVHAYCLQLKEEGVLDEYNTDDIIKDIYSAYLQSTLTSDRYNHFINGEWDKAYKEYKGSSLTAYEEKISEYIENNLDNPRKIIDDGCESLNDGTKELRATKGLTAFFASWAVLILPFIALSLGIYYGITAMIFGNMLYSSSFEWYNSLYSIIPASILSFVTAIFAREKLFRLIFRGKKHEKHDYNSIFLTEKNTFKQFISVFIVYIVTIMFIFLSANTGVSFGENTIVDYTDYLSVSGKTYNYSDVKCFCTFTYRDGSTGYGIAFPDYSNGIDLTKSLSVADIMENVVPILSSHGLELTEADAVFTREGDFVGVI